MTQALRMLRPLFGRRTHVTEIPTARVGSAEAVVCFLRGAEDKIVGLLRVEKELAVYAAAKAGEMLPIGADEPLPDGAIAAIQRTLETKTTSLLRCFPNASGATLDCYWWPGPLPQDGLRFMTLSCLGIDSNAAAFSVESGPRQGAVMFVMPPESALQTFP